MRRTIYIDDVQIDEFMLNNTERSKIEEILSHHNALGIEGVVSGLRVSINNGNALNVDVSAGSAVLPNKEFVTLNESQNNLSLISNDLGVANLILLTYRENYSLPKPSQLGDFNFNSYASTSSYVDIKLADEYLALNENSIDPNTQTKQNSLILGIVFGNGQNTPLLSTSIVQSQQDKVIADFSKFSILDGITIKSTNIKSTSKTGILKFDLQNRRLRFVSPNNPSPPEDNELGSGSLSIEEDLTNETLSDPDVPGNSIVIDVSAPIYPLSINSIDVDQMPDLIKDGIISPVFRNPTLDIDLNTLTSSQIQEFIEDETFSNFIINEEVNLSNLYVQNLTEIQNNVNVATTAASAVDRIHREIQGEGQTRQNNPHGLNLSNVIQLFDSFKGAINLGSFLKNSGQDALLPRIKSRASSRSKYTLLFETAYTGSSQFYPFRVYINSPGPDEEQFAGLTATINAKYSISGDNWVKDNPTGNSVRIQLNDESFQFHINESGDPVFSSWGNGDLEVFKDYIRFLGPLGILPKTNVVHNSSDDKSALLNVGESSDRPNKILIFENKISTLGDLRIYFGQDQALRPSLQEIDTGEVDQFGQPIIEEISFPTDTIDFVINAKPLLGQGSWQKEEGLPSYLFRYRFHDASLNSYRYTDLPSTSFFDGEWVSNKIQVNGGIRATENSVITGNFVINSEGISYESPRTRKKIIPLREIGWNTASGGDSAAYPVIDNLTNLESDNYFQWDQDGTPPNTDNFGVIDFGTPQRVMYENRGRNDTILNSPRYVWTGPRRVFFRIKGDAANLQSGDHILPGFSTYPSGIHRILIPLYFEEDVVDLTDVKIPISISGIDYANSTFAIPQTLDFGGALSDTSWYSVNFWDTNIVTGDASLISPPNDGSVTMTHEAIPGSSSEYMIHIRSSTSGSFLTLNKSSSFYGDLSVVFIHITSDRNTYKGYDQSHPNFDGKTYDYWHIGNPIVRYTTSSVV